MQAESKQSETVVEPSDRPASIDEAANSLDQLRVRLQHVEDQWRRSVADLDNLRKRYQRELERAQVAERERALGYWLTTLDDLNRSLTPTVVDGGGMVDGIRAIVAGATMRLESLGYPRFGEAGEVFDPTMHEVVSTIPASNDAPADTIVAIVKAGYGRPQSLLRPASVVVAKVPD